MFKNRQNIEYQRLYTSAVYLIGLHRYGEAKDLLKKLLEKLSATIEEMGRSKSIYPNPAINVKSLQGNILEKLGDIYRLHADKQKACFYYYKACQPKFARDINQSNIAKKLHELDPEHNFDSRVIPEGLKAALNCYEDISMPQNLS